MPSRTSVFKLLPWQGGINTNLDPSQIAPNQLVVGDQITYDTRGSKRKRDGIDFDWDTVTTGSASVIGQADYWFGTTAKTQRIVGVMSDKTVWSYNGGTATQLTVGGTAWSGTLTSASFAMIGNILIIAVSGSTNVMKYWDGSSDVLDVPGTPPNATMVRSHLGRIFCNDPSNPEVLNYCQTGDYTQWNGVGDSGGLPISDGDGDPIGINGIFPTFQGTLFIGKKTKLYRMDGIDPTTWQITQVSDGIGVASHNSIAAIDQDDCFFVSDKGVHSLSTTQAFGDFSSQYVSVDIQETFNNGFNRTRLGNVWAAYLPNINSIAFTFSSESSTVNDLLYLYNIPQKAWHTWSGIDCQSLIVANDPSQRRFYIGGSNSRIAKTFNGTNYDIDSTGTHVAVPYHLTSGIIFVDGDAYTTKLFRRFILFYKPEGNQTITVNVYVDNKGLNPENSLAFTNTQNGDLLDSTFILDTSILPDDLPFGTYVRNIDGVGRGIKLDITQTGVDQSAEIQGFAIEWEPAGINFET